MVSITLRESTKIKEITFLPYGNVQNGYNKQIECVRFPSEKGKIQAKEEKEILKLQKEKCEISTRQSDMAKIIANTLKLKPFNTLTSRIQFDPSEIPTGAIDFFFMVERFRQNH